MPDGFFVNDRKRKRSGGGAAGPSGGGGSARGEGSRRGSSARGGAGRGGGSRGGGGGKRGGGGGALDSERQRAARRVRSRPGDADDDEELRSDDSDDDGAAVSSDAGSLDGGRRGRGALGGPADERDEDAAFLASETAGERRLRLARAHLGRVRDQVELERETRERAGFFDAEEVDRENIAARLHAEEDSASGRIHAFIGSTLHTRPPTRFVSSFAADHATTSSAVAPGRLYVANKRGTVVAYAMPSLELCGRPFGQGAERVESNKGKKKKKQVGTSAAGTGAGGRNRNPASAAEAAAASGHRGEILCLAASEDGRYVVTGGRDKMLGVWEVQQQEGGGGVRWLRALPGHKDAVTSISIPALANASHHVLSASLSRHLCLHSLATLSLVDTLFGHQDAIASVSSLKPSVAVTSGARDRTCRWWKVEEEVQLVFRGGGRSVVRPEAPGGAVDGAQQQQVPKANKAQKPAAEFFEGSVDAVCMLDDSHFVSGGDTGSICLWHTGKKKPIFTVPLAHGLETRGPAGSPPQPRWITSLGALRGTDIFASGSWDGSIRLWSIAPTLKSFSPLFDIPARGFVNSLQISSVPAADVAEGFEARGKQVGKQAHVLVAAMAQEPRLGRWHRVHEAKNGTLLAHLTFA